jgi:hypothetical protein
MKDNDPVPKQQPAVVKPVSNFPKQAIVVIHGMGEQRQFLAHQRVAYLATADSRAVPHVVPVCFAIVEHTLYITIDEKPKRLSSLP